MFLERGESRNLREYCVLEWGYCVCAKIAETISLSGYIAPFVSAVDSDLDDTSDSSSVSSFGLGMDEMTVLHSHGIELSH